SSNNVLCFTRRPPSIRFDRVHSGAELRCDYAPSFFSHSIRAAMGAVTECARRSPRESIGVSIVDLSRIVTTTQHWRLKAWRAFGGWFALGNRANRESAPKTPLWAFRWRASSGREMLVRQSRRSMASAVAVAKDVFGKRGIGSGQLPPATGALLPLDEAAEAQRAARVEQDAGPVAPGVVKYTSD